MYSNRVAKQCCAPYFSVFLFFYLCICFSSLMPSSLNIDLNVWSSAQVDVPGLFLPLGS